MLFFLYVLPSFPSHMTQQLNKAKSLKDTNPEEARELLESTVRGNLVLFPHQFLVNEDLRPPLGSKENLISLAVFT